MGLMRLVTDGVGNAGHVNSSTSSAPLPELASARVVCACASGRVDCRKGYSCCWRKDCCGDDGSERSPKKAFSNKKSALLQLVEGSLVPKSIIFCNKIETCGKVENILPRFDRSGTRVRVLPFHSALAQGSRLADMEEFTNSNSKEVSQFLVCTDRASCGIDFSGVDHVILVDFPRDISKYVRSVGRTARGAGGIGKAFIFVVGK